MPKQIEPCRISENSPQTPRNRGTQAQRATFYIQIGAAGSELKPRKRTVTEHHKQVHKLRKRVERLQESRRMSEHMTEIWE